MRDSIGNYPPEKMPSLAVWALGRGFDGNALRDLAGLVTATRSNDLTPIEAALRELGKATLDPIAAGTFIANLVCKQIVAGEVSPYGGASCIWSVYDRCGRPKSLTAFVGCASEWEDDVNHRDHYDQLIVIAAKKSY